MTDTNETFLQRLRESNAKGPFVLQIKDSGILAYYGADFLAPIFGRWENESRHPEEMDSSQLADYLERKYLGKNSLSPDRVREGYHSQDYLNLLDGTRPGFTGGLVLRLEHVPHPSSGDARSRYPAGYTWLKIKPNPLRRK